MNEEISNKTLAFLLVGAIVVSLFGTFISLDKLNKLSGPSSITGMLTKTGTVQLDVGGLESFKVNTNINFGALSPNASKLWASTDTTNDWLGTNANDCTDISGGVNDCNGMIIENDGNAVLNISFNTTSNAASFIGGSDPVAPQFRYYAREGNQSGAGNEDGCSGSVTNGGPGWTEIAADTDYAICTGNSGQGFDFAAGSDKLALEFNLTIPTDAPQALKSATITIFNT